MTTFLTKRYDLVVAVPTDEPGLPSIPEALDGFSLYNIIEAAMLDNGPAYDYTALGPARAVEVEPDEDGWADPWEAVADEQRGTVTLTLDEDDVTRLIDALDSHEYWQLSEPDQRNDGYSQIEDGDDPEVDACRALQERLYKAVRAIRGTA